ncbi:MAG: non-ribosomal peptide synthase/polyketide synthase [Burkholderiales bacterium]|nr:non-ribosomal peptide synthase/polyketide synthase [Burkholderiales bacterium]
MTNAVPERIKTFVELLAHWAAVQPQAIAYRFLSYPASGASEETITYLELHQRARAIARHLLSVCRPGDRALMLYPSGLDFVCAYFGCLYAGVIAVPGYPPKRNQKLGRLKSLVQDCLAKVAMTDSQTQEIAEPQFAAVDELKNLSWLITDTLVVGTVEDQQQTGIDLPQVAAGDIAFLQYTSGSTGDPKGVMVTHGNLMANSQAIYEAMGNGPDTVVVGWLPLFHDMGLIGNVLQPMYTGTPGTFMAPASFLQRPLRWMEAVTKYRATASGGPNFGYDLCVEAIKDEELAQLDLSSWKVAFNGAEPIRPETLRAFSKRFAACGFDSRAHYACYGMAETTLLITGVQPGAGTPTMWFDEEELQANRVVPASGDAGALHELVNCGRPRGDQRVVIVNPETLKRCAEGEVGEIWTAGPSNAMGYWQKPEVTEKTFAACVSDTGEGPYLRTGDLGFVHAGDLYIAGRLKDVLIIRGANHYPQDIELTAFESHEAFMPNGAAAFTVVEDGQEQLVLVLEVRRTFIRNLDAEALARAVQQAVVLQHELQVKSIVFIKPGQLPKTSSGKVQRQGCKKQFLAGEIEAIARVDKAAGHAVGELKAFNRELWQTQSNSEKQLVVGEYLAGIFEAYIGLPAGTLQRDVPFIGYGLDSLRLTQIAARVADELDINLQVQHLFECDSVTALAARLNALLLDPASKRHRIARVGGESRHTPLSFAQQRMWFLMQYEPSSLYNISGLLRIQGELDADALNRAFQEIIRRHDALRTRFIEENFEPVQVVEKEIDWNLSLVDLSDRSQQELDHAIAQELHFVFNLSEDILFRATVYKQAEGVHLLAVCMHHIISDGWSVSVLMNELSALYAAFAKGQVSPLMPLPIQYPDYAVWQRAYLSGEVLARQEQYWQGSLQGVAPIALPTDKPRPATPTYAGHSIPLQLGHELTEQLKALGKQHGATLYMTLLAAFGTLLHKYSGQDDFCVGTPIANRTAAETKDLIGFFVNTLALRADYGGNPLFRDLLQQVKKRTIDAYAHQDLPFEKVVDLVQPERDPATSPLFQVMFVLQDQDPGSLALPGVEVRKEETASVTSKFDITLELREGTDGLIGHIEYKTDLFDELTILRLSSHFKRLLGEIVKAADAKLSDLSLLDEDERHTLLELWNDTEKTFRQPDRLHLLFARQAAATPNAVAVAAGQTSLSFAELDAKANQLAHRLIENGVGRKMLVGLCVERSIDMVVGMIAVLKAGAAYVPLDPTYPHDRLNYMLEQSKAAVLITRPELIPIFAGQDVTSVMIDQADAHALDKYPATAPAVEAAKEDYAYVIYTSGSTGKPKGVPISHAAICNQMGWVLNLFPMNASDRMLHKTPFSFDASVWEIWAPLISGAQLVLASPEGHKDVQYLVETIIQEKITVIQLVPALFRAMLTVPEINKITTLRRIFLGGEALPVDLAKQAMRIGGRAINLYGPTECSINASYYDAAALPEGAQGYVPIGKPVSNLQFYVLDANLCPVPVGVAGELYIAGAGLSDGYLHRPELTEERFIDNPFNTWDSPKLYKTGDLVRWTALGDVEFLARIDEQIKIRGFRIELGEIEAVLAKLPGVTESAVAVKGKEAQRLVAYVVAEDEHVSLDALRARMAAQLPEYMVPSVFVNMPVLPKNSSGKVDRKALPEPTKPNFTEYQPLDTKTEKALAHIWTEVLQIDEVNAKSNFFHIGGHSLLAARMVAQIRERWGIAFPIKHVFEAQELHALAALIDAAAGTGAVRIERIPRDAPLQLSFAQQRLWIVNQIDADSAQYNMPAAIDLHGPLNVVALERAIDAFIHRHEILRSLYVEQNGVPYQVIPEEVDFSLKNIDLSDLDATEQAAALAANTRQEALTPFDLARDLMLRATLVRLSSSRHTLLITLHHIASDGWSTTVMVRELNELYNAFAENRSAALPQLSCQYADYAAWQRKSLSGDRLQSLLSYWSGQLAQLPSVHNLPLDRARPAQPSYEGGVVVRHIPSATLSGLQRLARENSATPFMLIHAAFAGLLHRYSGESDIVVGTPIANRELTELEPLVGLFVNTLVVRSDFSENLNFLDLLEQSKATLLGAYDHQDLPFEMLVNELHAERSQSFNPLFQIMLVFQNGEENRLHFSGMDASEIRETAGTTKFDLTLNVVESGKELKLTWEYAKDLFDEASIVRLSNSFATLLDAVVQAPQSPIKRLPLVDAAERAALLAHCNADADDAYAPVCSHVLFEEQTKKSPDAIAVRFNGQAVTYHELNTRANQLAHYLRAAGIKPDTLIGLCVDRSVEMVVGLLAILKAGGAYVALDPTYPSERLRYQLEDSGVELIVTRKSLVETLPLTRQRMVFVDDQAAFAALPANNIAVDDIGLTPDSLSYVIYTSGSTGNPKASLLMHKGLSNLALAQIDYFRVDGASRVLQFASFAFDAATSEIFMALCAGATLHIVSKDVVQSGLELSDYVLQNKVTHATLPPALLPVLEKDKWQSVRHLTVAGEHCPLGLMQEWAVDRHFYNAYGPSETTVCSSMALLTPDSDVVHMGKPMRGVQLFVLDELMQPTPIGVAGQLYVGGRGVGRGYLGRDELNREKFVANAFGEGLLYATGDLARWRADGNLEFIGRVDNQVKLRGFRIELGEIEAALSKQTGVIDSVAIVHKDRDGNQRLVAYLVVDQGSFSTDELRSRLAETMPNYMVPSAFILVDKFPLNANGKVDRKRLPVPDLSSLAKAEYVAPSDAVEEGLAVIWGELLGLKQVGIHDNFFDLGGHSLLAIQAISRIKEKFGVQLKVADLFVYASIATLAKHIAVAPKNAAALPAVAPRQGGDVLPLTLEQQSYWFLYELEGGTSTYNIPAALRLTGKVNLAALEHSIAMLIKRHESLRTVLLVENGQPSQKVLTEVDFKLQIDDRKENRNKDSLRKQVELDAHYVFDLNKEIPIRVVLHKVQEDDYVLTVLLHHTMADGWSLDILIRELAAVYNAICAGKGSPLAELSVQYGDYALWQKQHLAGDYYENQVNYWRQVLKGVPPMLELPTDYPRPPVQSYRGKEVGFVLPFELTKSLNAFSRKQNTTLFNTLLAGLNVLLSRYSRSEDIAVGTAIANRSQTELETLIGCFANTIVLRNKVDQTASFMDLVERVNGAVFDAYEHSGVPFDVVVDAVQPERSLGVPPIFQVMFRLHNHKTGHGITFSGVETERINIETDSAKLDLNFSLIETDGCMEGVIEYATDLFSEKTVRRIARHFQLLLESAMAEPQSAVERLNLLSKEEFELVEKWNSTDVPYPQDECVYQLFEKSVERVPQKIAYVMGDTRLTYTELNQRANRLAYYLLSKGVGSEVRVGVSTGRDPWAPICMLAVFKAGGTYVPLDPNYPRERIDVMLDVVKPKIILTRTEIAGLFDGVDADVIHLDQVESQIAEYASDNLPSIGADHSAYILFTSGTTGRPKAILIGHRAFRNMPVAHEWARVHSPDSRVLQFASLSFSISMWDSFMAWVPGGTVIAVTQEENLPGEPLYALLEREKVTHATWPVSLLSTVPVDRMPTSLQTIISSAEPCNDAVVARWTARGVRFLNMYGNSEVSLGSTIYEYHKVGQKLTIGVAFPNTRMYLLDKYLRQVPIGVIAEIHTAGAGLATCYWDNPVATAKSFIPNPFAKGRLYKTGDLGRYLPNGEIEFIGREDFQVSIRGFRVELVEIENVLRAVPAIAEVVVVAQDDANKLARLVCFYVEQPEAKVDVNELRALVARKLPSYMVPSLFVRLDAMPLTPNRKIDRLGLPKPSMADDENIVQVAPRNPMEESIAAIWSEVLGLEHISVNRNFFEIGGHSLLAVQVVARIKDKLGLPLTIKDLFTHTTIESLAEFLGSVESSGQSVLPPVVKREEQGRIPLSLDQKPYWFLHQLEGGSYTYNIPLAMRLNGALNVDALEKSFDALIARHEALRTVFPMNDGEPAQEILPSWQFKMPVVDIAEENIEEQVGADFTYIFDLAKELPIRVRLLRIAEDRHVVTLVIHHVVADGWSLNILIKEMIETYTRYAAKQLDPLPELALQYGDYSQWQHKNVVGDYYNRQIEFWKQKLSGLAPLLNLPLDYSRPPVQSYRGKELPISLPFSLTAKLNQYARQHNTTLYNLLLSGLAILLSRYGRTNDIPVGTAVANRPQKELEPLIGCFANTLVIRCRVNPKESFGQLVSNVSNEALEAFSNSSVPFDGVVEAVQPQRSLGVPPIFQVMFRLHNQQMAATDAFAGLKSELVNMPTQSAKLDLNFSLVETADGLKGVIEYATDIFSEETVARICRHYQTVLEAAIADTTQPIEKLSVVTHQEMEQVRQWNANVMPYPQDECMHHLFERTVERNPNKLAYVCGNDRFTYAELNARANRLAHFLQSVGVGPEVRVGVSVERSTWAGICGLAVAKSGGTYVPLDINYPKDRIERMLEVAKPKIILTLEHLKPLFADTGAQLIALDTQWRAIQSQPITNPPRIGAAHSAYILFTSGTTGKPKGILVGHRAFRNMANSQQWAGLYSQDSRVLQFASLSFSISFWGAYMAWVPGGTIYSVTTKENLPDEPLYEFMEAAQITHVTWPVSLLSTVPIDRMPKSLRVVVSSAEPCNDAVVAKWTALGIRFLNLYGNSEVSLGSTIYEYHKVGEKLTIGKAFPNTQMYLLDENLKQVPIGVIAEIHTAGVGLATCYVDDPVATAKSFIPNPFSDDPVSRMYKTGDLGRYLPNGEIEFIGREDFQVSVRGFRVELTEIEDVLRAVPGLLEVVVNAREDQQGVARLVCYYTQSDGINLTAAELRKTVAEKLPNYMVPATYVLLDAMPLTPNRKIDRLALQVYPLTEGGDDTYVAPRNDVEKRLVAIWTAVLDAKEIGVMHDFFELGGHSLLATKIVSRIRSEFSVDLSIQQFFENSTIERLAGLIALSADQAQNPIKILIQRDTVPLSFAQQRLWFLDRYEENSNFYHMPSLMRITGDVNVEALNKAFAAVVERHEVLRTNFISIDGQGFQKIHPSLEWKMELVDLAGGAGAEKEENLAARIREQLGTPFDLENDALLRAALYKFDEHDHRLFINMHHIVSDGWSITVLINEISALYAAFAGNKPAALPELQVQYADFAAWQIDYLQGAVLEKQGNYWLEKLRDLSTLPLPTDFERPKTQTYNGDRVTFALDQSLVSALDELSAKQGTTLFMTLLSAFNVLLSKYAGHDDICIGTPIANRVRAEIEPLIGFFANTLVLRSDLEGDPAFADFLQQVKKTTLEAYSHQDIPFEKVVDLVLPERDASRSPLFQVSFALQNPPAKSFDMEGITLENVELENKTSKFDMHCQLLSENGGENSGISGYFEYNTDLFAEGTVRSYVNSFQALLRAIVADPQCSLSHLSLSGAASPQHAVSIGIQNYPVLQALYGDAIGADSDVDCWLLDDTNRAVPDGAIGKLYFDVGNCLDKLAVLSGHAGNHDVAEVGIGDRSHMLLPSGFTARRRNGALELISSIDDVALIDGRLIYPRIVEQHLLAMPGMLDCHVCVRRHGQLGDRIVAYVVCEDEELQADALTRRLQESDLAGVDVFACVKVDAIPLNASGEVNDRALRKHAVFNSGTRQTWLDAIKQSAAVNEAVFLQQVANERQKVSHLHDLLPPEARGISNAPVVSKARKAVAETMSKVPALVMGGDIHAASQHPKVLADMLINAALKHGDKGIRFYHTDGSTADIPYADLLHKAQCVLAGLRQTGLPVGGKVIFQFDKNEDFVTTFWACELGGFIPVPIAPAKDYRKSNAQTVKVAHAWKMMDQAIVVAGSSILAGVANVAKLEAVDGFKVHDVAALAACEPAGEFHKAASNDVALVMLTSGSTGLPKGVQLTHANLIGRTLGSAQMNGFHSEMASLNWMALDHVGGIIYFHIRDTYLGAQQVQVDTDYILADPIRWLQLIDRHRVNITWAPNFAFSLIVDRQDELKKLSLDLSCLHFMLNGAEAVVPKTTQAFIELMQQFKMPEETVKPVYGMSEISSGVTYAKKLQLTYGADETVFVSVGAPIPGVNLRIVDENDQVKMEGQSGRLQVSGVTVTKGYLGGDDINKDVFTEDGWFKTGDLAFIENGELTITGREKNIIIINGVNFYSHEIESVVEGVPGVVVSFTGACAVRGAGSNSDQLAIFFNTALRGEDQLALIRKIRQAVIEKVGINPSFIVPLEKEQVPKTEIGKIQLPQLAKTFNRGDFNAVLRKLDIAEQNENTLPDWFFSKAWVQKQLGNVVEMAPQGATLVFADQTGCASELVLPGKIITVTSGSSYRESDDSFQINPGVKDHYGELVASLKQKEIAVGRVINCWDYDAGRSSTDSFLSRPTLSDAIGLYSGWYLAQAFAAQETPGDMRWIWVARRAQKVDADDALNPDKGAVIALLKTLTKEFSWLSCRHVDLAGDDIAVHAAMLAKEIQTRHADEEVAYRGPTSSRRLVLRLKKERLVTAEKRELPIAAGAGYLISGGLGGIAYELAKLLLKQFNARLLLVGRTPPAQLSAEKKDMLDELQQLGNVIYAEADICNHAQVESAVDTAEGQWKQKLGGIFHLAGLAHEEAMAGQSIQSLHDALRAKTSGTRVLYNVCSRRNNTLFVNFSSVNGFFGSSGMAAYNIGNRYQAAFLEAIGLNKNVNTFCISWSLWHDTGMGAQYKHAEALSRALGFRPIPAAKGMQSMLAVLVHRRRDVLVGLDDTRPNIQRIVTGGRMSQPRLVCCFTANEEGLASQISANAGLLDEFAQPLNAQFVQLDQLPRAADGSIDLAALRKSLAASGQTRVEKVAPRDELEEKLTKIATEIFGASEPIGIKDNFFDVGANSLLIVKLHHEIQKELGIEFPMVELFNSTTVEKLAKFLGQQSGGEGGGNTADAARAAGQERRAAMQRRNRSRTARAGR